MDDAVGLTERVTAAARVAQASQADDDWHAYWTLARQAVEGDGGQVAWQAGTRLLQSPDALERMVGCDLLGTAADEHERLRAGAATALLALAEAETAPLVLSSLVCALGRTHDARAVTVLVDLSRHEEADLRCHVASQFASVHSSLPDGPDVRALIRLTRDRDPDVRNWAAFTLGSQLDQDTTAIRDALWRCTTDEYGEVREEGARGLARRHDPRAVPLIAHLLGTDSWSHNLTLDAAAILGVPELLPALAACQLDPAETDRALAACDPARRARIQDDAWKIVLELERLHPDIDAALSSPRYASVHELEMTVTSRQAPDARYEAAALLTRADGDPARAAGLVAADLARPAAAL
ncbi:HEAT repeat domain-containing protein [Kitasatospora sp. NPDC001547]|uniref:HEAT repeat domain-containing protein n=1 Tax=Kitasatospora sp. NPDC001547 TaxID=3364015 RepID=UPI0036D1F407